jgi:phosphohistidine swiveling domain-containing protein
MNTQRELTRSVPFMITGEAITEHARLHVLSGQWQEAQKLLAEGVEGMTHDTALSILRGEYNLVGSSDDDTGLELVDADPNCAKLKYYLDTFAFQNCGLLEHEGKVYRPAYEIVGLGPDDFDHALKKLGEREMETEAFFRERIEYYIHPLKGPRLVTLPSDLLTRTVVDLRNESRVGQKIVVWLPREDVPLWAVVHLHREPALAEFYASRQPDHLGLDSYYLDLYEDADTLVRLLDNRAFITDHDETLRQHLLAEKTERLLKGIREQIAERAGPVGGEGWMRLAVGKTPIPGEVGAAEYYFDIPKAPFLYWALQPYDPAELGLCEPWQAISGSGWKCYGDAPHHTDWVIGAGLDPENFHKQEDVNASSYALRMELCFKLLKFEFAVLSRSSKTKLSGKVRILNPGDVLQKGEIGVIERASVEYDAALRSAAQHDSGLICLTGGPLAHVAVVGREMNVPIIMWDKAKLLSNGARVDLNLERGTIRLDPL